MESAAARGAPRRLALERRRGAADRALPVRPPADALRARAAPRGSCGALAAAAHRLLGARSPAGEERAAGGDTGDRGALLRSHPRARRSARRRLRAQLRTRRAAPAEAAL